MMYGQMTAGSWIYIGTQGILQGTYETFAAAARVHFGAGADLRGRLVVSGGLGGMGGAQPLAVTMNGGVFLGIDVDPTRIQRRLETRYLDEQARDLDDALARCAARARRRGARSRSGSRATARACCPSWCARGVMPDLVTDQTSAHDPLRGYVPAGVELGAGGGAARSAIRRSYIELARRSMAEHVRAMIELKQRGAHAFDYGNNLRGQALLAGPDAKSTASRTSRASCRPTSARCSARARGRSAGRRSRAIRTTSPSPTTRSSSCFPRTRTCTAG